MSDLDLHSRFLTVRIGIIYLVSGVGGSVLSSLFRSSIHRYCTVRLAGLAGFAYNFVVSAEHLSARFATLWQAASPLINFAASEAD